MAAQPQERTEPGWGQFTAAGAHLTPVLSVLVIKQECVLREKGVGLV